MNCGPYFGSRTRSSTALNFIPDCTHAKHGTPQLFDLTAWVCDGSVSSRTRASPASVEVGSPNGTVFTIVNVIDPCISALFRWAPWLLGSLAP